MTHAAQKAVVILSTLLCGLVPGQMQKLPAKPPGEFSPRGARDHEKAEPFERGQPIVGTTYFY